MGIEFAQWNGNLLVRTVGDFKDSDQPLPHPEGTRTVSSHTEVDLTGGWQNKDWKIDLGIKNLFDEEPPFSAQNANSNVYTQMGFAELVHEPRPVLLRLGALQVPLMLL